MIGVGNVGVGYQTLLSTTDGDDNTAIGVEALQANKTGSDNTAVGAFALFQNDGFSNTATGGNALLLNTGNSNTANGAHALENNSSGSNNVAVGNVAGQNATTGSNNIYLGAVAVGVAGESRHDVSRQGWHADQGVHRWRPRHDYGRPQRHPRHDRLGGSARHRLFVGRFKEDVHDMNDASRRLLDLRPVTFRYTQAYGDGAKPIQYGLIAEEVAEVFPELAVRGADGQVETVHYETLNVLLVNEVQKQQQRIEALEQKVNALLERLTP